MDYPAAEYRGYIWHYRPRSGCAWRSVFKKRVIEVDDSGITVKRIVPSKVIPSIPWAEVRSTTVVPEPSDVPAVGRLCFEVALMSRPPVLFATDTEQERVSCMEAIVSRSSQGMGYANDLEEEELAAIPAALWLRVGRTFVPTYQLRSLVSDQKFRFQDDDLDLDLTYITKQIIALGYPCVGQQSLYRNPYPEVLKFFEKYHKGHYRLYNLCSEAPYPNPTWFDGSFEYWPFDDHNPSSLTLMYRVCESAKAFIEDEPGNVVAVHCKAGKGRTGTIIAAILLWIDECSEHQEALDKFAVMRTKNAVAVTNPSQIRYVSYLERIKKNEWGSLVPRFSSIFLKSIQLRNLPNYGGTCVPYYWVFQFGNEIGGEMLKVYDSREDDPVSEYPSGGSASFYPENSYLHLQGDIKFEFYNGKKGQTNNKEDSQMFYVWVHTSFLPGNGTLVLKKADLDKAWKDEKFSSDFEFELEYEWDDRDFEDEDGRDFLEMW
eukprot:TRINITY_DN7002_c0_g1_i1.p1 TRINITY_DN7002_c0_g1~~TRINITY_DN7002_c0_g1_i1.p1  ORF type:complete len:489 (+),score=75.15 TRINITY_DN7002_c0_g1_i1:112-1578(+)